MWPFKKPVPPSESTLKEKQLLINDLSDALYRSTKPTHELMQAKEELANHFHEYAILLRDAGQFEHAQHQCHNAKTFWNELDNPYKKLEVELTRISILAQTPRKENAMRALETVIPTLTDNPLFAPLLEIALLHHAGLFYSFGHTSLATKDIDHVILLREKRTKKLDPELLDFRHSLLLMDTEALEKNGQSNEIN